MSGEVIRATGDWTLYENHMGISMVYPRQPISPRVVSDPDDEFNFEIERLPGKRWAKLFIDENVPISTHIAITHACSKQLLDLHQRTGLIILDRNPSNIIVDNYQDPQNLEVYQIDLESIYNTRTKELSICDTENYSDWIRYSRDRQTVQEVAGDLHLALRIRNDFITDTQEVEQTNHFDSLLEKVRSNPGKYTLNKFVIFLEDVMEQMNEAKV